MCVCVQDVVLEFMQETRELRSEVAERDQTVCLLQGEIADISVSCPIHTLHAHNALGRVY